MTEVNPTHLDKTGKVVLDQVYNLDRPDSYYSAVEQLDYDLPQLAKPVFDRILRLLEKARQRSELKVVDLGCSYGVNAALLKWGLDLETVVDHYKQAASEDLGRDQLVRSDREWLGQLAHKPFEILGVDISRNALDYALDAGFLDGKIIGNFEEGPLSVAQQQRLRNADLIMSTGCIGYVTEKTVTRLLQAAAPNKPWMAHFVLRMFPFDPMQEMLAQRDYVTLKSRKPLRQRRFASDLERDKALSRLGEMGIDTKGLEQDGWYYADLFFSIPKEDMSALPPVEDGVWDF